MSQSGGVHATPMADISNCQFSSRNSPYLKYPSRPRFTSTQPTPHSVHPQQDHERRIPGGVEQIARQQKVELLDLPRERCVVERKHHREEHEERERVNSTGASAPTPPLGLEPHGHAGGGISRSAMLTRASAVTERSNTPPKRADELPVAEAFQPGHHNHSEGKQQASDQRAERRRHEHDEEKELQSHRLTGPSAVSLSP